MRIYNISYTTEVIAHSYAQTEHGILFMDANENLIAKFPVGGLVPETTLPNKLTAEIIREKIDGLIDGLLNTEIAKAQSEKKGKRGTITVMSVADNAKNPH